jgi:hypothetical protein
VGRARYPSAMRPHRYLVALAAWFGAGYTSLWVAANTKIGPTVANLSPTHGIHTGDVVIVCAGVAAASVVTAAALRSPRS